MCKPHIFICFYVYFVFLWPSGVKKGSSDQPTPEKNMEEELHLDLDEIMADLEEIQVFFL